MLPPPLPPPPAPPATPPGKDLGVALRGEEFLIVGVSLTVLLLAVAAWCLYRRRCRKMPAANPSGSQNAHSGKSGGTHRAFAERQAAAGRALWQEKVFVDRLPAAARADPCGTGSGTTFGRSP